jgi:hypothetical protein
MTLLLNRLRALLAAMILLFGAGGALAQDGDAPWRASISGQIEAFRKADAPGAFSYASAPFKVQFPTAEAFFLAIVGSGYGPIMESRSHSFGAFTLLEDSSVLQEVSFVANDQSLYGAVYQLTEEPEGWRVMGVQLTKQPGIGI